MNFEHQLKTLVFYHWWQSGWTPIC